MGRSAVRECRNFMILKSKNARNHNPESILKRTLIDGYCKSGKFRDNFIFASSVLRNTCNRRIQRLGYDLPLSVVDRVISPFREDLIFTKLRMCEVSRK